MFKVYQNLKTKIRLIATFSDGENLKENLTALCWKQLGMGVLKETTPEEAKANRGAQFTYKSVLIFQSPVYLIIKEI